MRRTTWAAAATFATVSALAAGDRDAATIDEHRALFSFPSGKFGDYSIAAQAVREKAAAAGGALVVSGTATKPASSAALAVPNGQSGAFTADLVVDLTSAGARSAADAPGAFFGLDFAAVRRGISVQLDPSGVSVFVGDDAAQLGGTTVFAQRRLALHVERTATAVIFEAGPVGSAPTPLGSVAHSFGASEESSLVLEVRSLRKGESVALDDLALAGAVSSQTSVYLARLRTVLGIERNARSAAAASQTTTATTALDDGASVLTTNIPEALSDKAGSPPALKKALGGGISRMKAAAKLLAKAKKLVVAGKDAGATIDAAIDATLAAGHALRGMSVAEAWDPGP